MKRKITALCCLAALLLSLAACGGEAPEQPSAPAETNSVQDTPAPLVPSTPDTPEQNSGVLIAYFSMIDIVPEGADAVTHATPSSGNTQTAALTIQGLTGGELFQIQTEQTYPFSHSECSAIAEEEMRSDARPALTTHVEDMEDYDTVFLGYPIWWYTAPMCVRTFLEEYDFTGKTIIPFCTTLGAGVGQSVDEIKELCPEATVLDGLTLSTGRDSEKKITEWVDGLGLEFAPAPQGSGEQTPITLTIGDTVLEAYLNGSVPAQSLLAQLPLTVSLSDSDNDFCGGSLDIDYTESDVQSGYRNGDLAFWPPASNFVIFVSDEESSANTGNLVILGHITSPQAALDALEGRIDVTIATSK